MNTDVSNSMAKSRDKVDRFRPRANDHGTFLASFPSLLIAPLLFKTDLCV